MKISDFVLSVPNSSGNMHADIHFVVDNPTKSEIHRVYFCVTLRDKTGATVGGRAGYEDCLIGQGEDALIDRGISDVSVHCVGDELDNVKACVNATLYAREFHLLGEIDAPAKDYEVVRHAKSVKSAIIDGNLVLTLLREPVDEDGNVVIKMWLELRNRCDKVLPDAQLGYRLLDRQGSEAVSSRDVVDVRANGTAIFDTYLVVKKPRLRAAKMTFDLSLLHPVHVTNCDAMSMPEEE